MASLNPYLFIVGCPRSGTTLLRRLVDAHPLIAIPREQHWLAKWFERRKGVTPEGTVTPELIDDLLEYEKFVRLGIGREDLEGLMASGQAISYASFVSSVFDLYGQARGKPLVGDKTPAYVRSIPTLSSLWPEARFVHITRDGRDVCLSAINWDRSARLADRFSTWREDPVTTAALWWEHMARAGHEAGGQLAPGLYHELRYETLIRNPEGACRKLCEFLEVPYEDAMLHFHEGRTKTKPGLDAKKAWLPVTSGLRDWRTEMSDEDTERFEAAVGGLLDELCYERAFPNPSPRAVEHASKLRAVLAEQGSI
ncbi:MAG: sulfotransferase family protein [Rubrobacter sp.]